MDFRGGSTTVSVAVLLPLYQAMKTMESARTSRGAENGLVRRTPRGHCGLGPSRGPRNSTYSARIAGGRRNRSYNRYIIVKAIDENPTAPSPQQEQHHLAIVISKPGLEELLSPLGFALAGACAGWNVSIYFQGPAVSVLQTNFRG